MCEGSTAALCAPVDGLFVSFPAGLRMLGIPRQTAERWLRRRDPRLPPVLRSGSRRYFAVDDIRARRNQGADWVSEWAQRPNRDNVDHLGAA